MLVVVDIFRIVASIYAAGMKKSPEFVKCCSLHVTELTESLLGLLHVLCRSVWFLTQAMSKESFFTLFYESMEKHCLKFE